MSLIHDALNKTDQYLERFVVSKPVRNPAPAHTPLQQHREPEIKKLEKEIKRIETPKISRRTLALSLAALLAVLWLSRIIVPAPAKNAAPKMAAAVAEAEPVRVVNVNAPKPDAVVVEAKHSFFDRTPSKLKFSLTGITSSDDNVLLAVINDQVVGVGDTLREGALVTKITADRVILDIDGQKIVLTF